VAVVQGLAGLGKTALAGEGIHLWHGQFKYVLCFQAKPTPLQLDEFLRQVDFRLTNVSPAYRERCERNERDRVYLPVGTLPAEQRDGLLLENLIQALRNEAVLLVLDNWETNLEPQPTAEHGYRARDPRWDRLLERLSAELPATRSRLLVTTRHRPAALADASRVEWLPLGPLPPAEAGLYVRAHDGLRALYFSGGDEGRELVERLLQISRGHPLIVDRLARLAPDRPALAAALDQLETGGLSRLPDLFAAASHPTDADRERERQYLERQALAVCNRLPDPSDRAISHANLAAYLEKLGRADRWPQHDLAAVVYLLSAGHGQHVRTWLHNLANRIRRAAAAGGRYELPRRADLLARSAFAPLATWLAANQIDLDQLQAGIDQLVEQTRRQA
jgi:hypothetical protein